MKISKKIISLLLTLSLVLGTAPMVFAQEASGIGVQVNGTDIAFTDAKPLIAHERVYVPIAATSDAFGAEATYYDDTQSAVITKDNYKVTFKLNNSFVEISDNGKKSSLYTETPAFIDASTNRFYVPIRFLANAFGYEVGWDSANNTAILVDFDSIISEYEGKFTILDKYLAYSKKYMNDNYALDGNYSFKITVADGEETLDMSAIGDISGISSKTAMELNIGLAFDISQLEKLLEEESGNDAQKIFDSLKDTEFNCIFNIETGKLYMQSPFIDSMIDSEAPTWFYIDYNELMSTLGTGFSFKELMSIAYKENTLDIVKTITSAMPLDNKNNTAYLLENVKAMLDLLSDDSFVKVENGYLLERTMETDGIGMDVSVLLNTKNDEIVSYSLKMTAKQNGSEISNISAETNEKDVSSFNVTMSVEGIMDMVMSGTMSMQKTDKVPKTEPDEGSAILSIMDMLNY